MKAENLSSEDIQTVRDVLRYRFEILQQNAAAIKAEMPKDVTERYYRKLQLVNDEAQYIEALLGKFNCHAAILVTDNKGE